MDEICLSLVYNRGSTNITLSLTRVSSTAAKLSNGPRSRCAKASPPQYSVKPPISSAKTSSTSSSSSKDSCKKGINSSRARSGPRARAIVDNLRIAFSLSVTSSPRSSSAVCGPDQLCVQLYRLRRGLPISTARGCLNTTSKSQLATSLRGKARDAQFRVLLLLCIASLLCHLDYIG